jgi:DNA-binding MarR family transcriptional regulator
MPARVPPHFVERFSEVKRRLAAVVDQEFAPLGIGSTQAKLLRAIQGGSTSSQADLARTTGTDPAAAGRALRTLLDRRLVRRRRSRDDRRAFALQLSAEGEALLGQVQAARDKLAARIEACLDRRDLAAFERIARKLLDTFQLG